MTSHMPPILPGQVFSLGTFDEQRERNYRRGFLHGAEAMALALGCSITTGEAASYLAAVKDWAHAAPLPRTDPPRHWK